MMTLNAKPPMWAPKCDVCRRPLAVGHIEEADYLLFVCAECWPKEEPSTWYLFDMSKFMTESDI